MNILLTPPENHFDSGLGISAWNFRSAANTLKSSDDQSSGMLPICYLQRHSLELYLKSLIYILHKKFSIPFGDGFDLEKPAIQVNDKWKALSNTHNLTDLYRHFTNIFDSSLVTMPSSTDWTLPPELNTQINLINGYDPKSTYFRYPKATNQSLDSKKSEIQPIDVGDDLGKFIDNSDTPVKCVLMLDENDNVTSTYSLTEDPIVNVKEALDEAVETVHNLQCAFLGELTNWS